MPTSNSTRDLATQLGVPLADLNDVGELDLTIDGADEIDAK
jgi:ribose 5-phosphate isomerase A